LQLGGICLYDHRPVPEGLTEEMRETMQDYASLVMNHLEQHRQQQHNSDPAQLIAYAAHDLMTPLTGVQLSLSLLTEDEHVQEALHPQQLELLTTATNCSDLMIRICHSAIHTLRKEEDTERKDNCTDLVDLVKNLKLICKPLPKRVPLIWTLDTSIPMRIQSDELTVFRATLNLVTAALSRTEQGKVHVSIFGEKEDDRDFLVVQIEDTAGEIPVEDYQILFQNPSASFGDDDKREFLLTLSAVANLVSGADYGFRPVDDPRRGGSIFWFRVPYVTATEGLSTSGSSGLLNRRRRIFRSGSNSSTSLRSLPHQGRRQHGFRTNNHSTNSLFDFRHQAPTATASSANAVFEDFQFQAPRSDIGPNPLIVASAARSNAMLAAAMVPKRVKRALVIEDSMVVRKGLARALGKLGYQVMQAVNGLEGLEAMKATMFDLVLCDFLMPVMDGLDCVKQYRAWETENRLFHRQPIVGISAHVSVADSAQGIKAGMDDFRPKPISIKTLTDLQSIKVVVKSGAILDELQNNSEKPVPVDVVEGANLVGASPDRKRQASVELNDPSAVPFLPQKRTYKSPSTQAGRVCLVAMNDEVPASDFQQQLQSAGWKVVNVHDGKDAIRLMKMRNWDAVLMEESIGSESALACMEEFRDWEEKNRVNEQCNVFCVCTDDIPGPFDPHSVVQPPSGFNGVLRKPIVWKELDFMVKKQCVKIISQKR